MKVEYVYEVTLVVNEDEGAKVEAALKEAAKKFNTEATVDEVQADPQPEPEEEGEGTSED